MVHRFLIPAAKYVDHRNGDGLDNRASNIRACSAAENGCHRVNLNKNNVSGAGGVRFRAEIKKWSATIMSNRKSISLGVYLSKEEAVAARRAAELVLFGPFAAERLSCQA